VRETRGIASSTPPPDDRRRIAARLTDAAERFDELADIAELMGDDATEHRFRGDAARCREQAMAALDRPPPEA
jgi:hypothetical protein